MDPAWDLRDRVFGTTCIILIESGYWIQSGQKLYRTRSIQIKFHRIESSQRRASVGNLTSWISLYTQTQLRLLRTESYALEKIRDTKLCPSSNFHGLTLPKKHQNGFILKIDNTTPHILQQVVPAAS